MQNTLVFRYKNTLFFLTSLIFAFIVFRLEPLHVFLLSFGNLGFIGAFFAGIFYDFTFTGATAAVILLVLAQKHPIPGLWFYATCGSVLGDIFIFSYLKNNFVNEIKTILKRIKPINEIRHSKRKTIKLFITVIGSIMIASPLPDELGIGLLGFSGLSILQFSALSLVLNSVGIFALLSLSGLIRP